MLTWLTCAAAAASSMAVTQNSSRIFDVTAYGAVGDGETDDTKAFQAAFDALGTSPGQVRVPTGSFLLTSTVNITCPGLFSFRGDGPASNLLWSADRTLFEFSAKDPVAMATVSDLTVSSVARPKSSFAFVFPAGLVKSQVDTVQIIGSGGLPSGSITQTFPFGGGFDLGKVTDTSTLRNCLLWFCSGEGVIIGGGSEVRLEGGRLIGTARDGGPENSIGVHVTGGNGGVHIMGTDIISWGMGVALDTSSGGPSNREIFITHGTIDSNFRGLAIFDSSYVSIAGCWMASSTLDNIWTHPDSNPQVTIAGGTIFNAGALGGDCDTNQCNGMTVNSGTFVLSGVEVRNNKGKGIWTLNSDKVRGFTVSGCRITDNGIGAKLAAQEFALTGNVFSGNIGCNLLLDAPSLPHIVANNVGL